MANPEGQHFLLSPDCRTLTVLDLAKMRDATAYDWFKRLRWPETEGGLSASPLLLQLVR